MVRCQGGDEACIHNPEKLGHAPISEEVKADRDGYITAMDTTGIGIAAMMLGAGRETKESKLDYLAGIVLTKKTGDAVKAGETIAELLTSEEGRLAGASARYMEAVTIEARKPEREPLIYALVSEEGVHYTEKEE
jgi:pyrimidine-nucleoside phosphorylase